jgi:cytochrome c-type biogenesis protein CcmH/NrfG
MMGWVIMLVLALLVAAGLWRWMRGDMGMIQFLGAALLLALAGYAWQGRPGLAGAPKAPPPPTQQQPDSAFAEMRPDLMGQFNNAAHWLSLAESYQRTGNSKEGVEIIQNALRRMPNNADLWVGLGNALIQHSDGLMTPAAELAFDRASQIAPDHPGPRFFYGLALAQGGRFDEAEQTWRALLASAPPSATWRGAIQEQLDALAQARASGRIPPAAAPSPAPVPAP